MKSKSYTHDFDFVAVIVSPKEFTALKGADFRKALLNRINNMSDEEMEEAVGHIQTQEGDLNTTP